MKKLLQISFIIFVILMVLAPNFVQATGVNMNLTANTSTPDNTTIDNENTTSNESEETNSIQESDTQTDALTPSSTNYSSNSATVSSLNQLPEAGLGLNNIINIILIVIGVLLILLGIAILIRLKQ